MGSVEPYSTAAGRRYRVRYRDPDRRSRERAGFATKREAELYLSSVDIAAARGEYVDPSAARATVATVGARWLAGQSHLKPSSAATVEIAWRCYVLPRWGETPVGRIRHSDVQAWIGHLTSGTAPTAARSSRSLGPTSVIRAHGVLAGLLDVAVKDRLLATNPARGVNLPRRVRRAHPYLTHQQVDALAAAAGRHAPLVLLLSYTGLRWGEATALRIQDLDMLRRRITVAQNAVRVNGRIVVGTPKTHHARSVPFPDFLAPLIAEQCAQKRRDQLVFGDGNRHQQQSASNTGWFAAAVRQVRTTDPAMPAITVHDLRHTAASLAISAGANVKAVQRMLGHASAAMTLDVYADLFDDDLDAVSTALGDARRAAVVGDLWGVRAESGRKDR